VDIITVPFVILVIISLPSLPTNNFLNYGPSPVRPLLIYMFLI